MGLFKSHPNILNYSQLETLKTWILENGKDQDW